jgi:hypothetical protein
MFKHPMTLAVLGAAVLSGVATGAHAATFTPNDPNLPDIRITEFMYKNDVSPAEFVQVTNLGSTAVSMANFSEDDGSDKPGVHSLASMGTLQPGQSGILAESTAASFESAWNLPSTLPFAQENSSDNLGKSDIIYLFDNVNGTQSIVDELNYEVSGSPLTDGDAAVPGSASAIGTNNAAAWVLLKAGSDGAFKSNGGTGDTGSPGFSSFAVAPVPLPAAAWLFMSGFGALAPMLRRRKAAVQAAV